MRYLSLVLCATPIAAHAEPLRIVTDIPAVHSLVSQVIGERGEVSVLLAANADPHHFQLRPSQSREIAKADVLIWVGEELTPWLARARDGIAADLESLELLGAISGGIDEPEEQHDDDHADDDHHVEDDGHSDHGHDGVNPHIWLGFHESEAMLHEIAEHLGELDPDGAESFERNAYDAIEKLEALEHQIEERLAASTGAPFVVAHDAHTHFIAHFDLNMVDSLTDVHDSPASAKHVSKLVEMVEQKEIRCVFPEVGESEKLANVLVEKGAKLGQPLDPAGVSLDLGPDLHRQLLLDLTESFADCLGT